MSRITIQTCSLDPSGVGSRSFEIYRWDEDLGYQGTLEIADLYRQAGYQSHSSHVYEAYQMYIATTGNTLAVRFQGPTPTP